MPVLSGTGILSSKKKWNNMTSYAEALLISRKFDLDERSIMNVYTTHQILLRNSYADMEW